MPKKTDATNPEQTDDVNDQQDDSQTPQEEVHENSSESGENENSGSETPENNETIDSSKNDQAVNVDLKSPELEVNVEIIKSSQTPQEEDPRLVEVKVNYPKNFSGKKYLKDDAVIKVSPEVADRYEQIGIAKRLSRKKD